MELFEGGNAYYGQHNEAGEREGFGVFVTSFQDKYIGEWKNNLQEGEYDIRGDFTIRGKGSFVAGKPDGLWQMMLTDGSYMEKTYKNGEVLEEKILYEEHNPNLETALTLNNKLYGSIYEEKKQLKDLYIEMFGVSEKKGDWESTNPSGKFKVMKRADHYAFDFESIFSEEPHKLRLIEVTETAEKRIERYDYTFQENYGHSQPTVTIYSEYQKIPEGDGQYNIVFQFQKDEYKVFKYYINGEEYIKSVAERNKETQDQIQEIQNQIGEMLEKLEEDK